MSFGHRGFESLSLRQFFTGRNRLFPIECKVVLGDSLPLDGRTVGFYRSRIIDSETEADRGVFDRDALP